MSLETRTDEAPPDSSDLYKRAWRDLDTWRLAVAPVLPIVLGGGLSVFGSPFRYGPAFPFIWMAMPAEIWSAAFGTFFLVTAPRRFGTIARANCLFAGGLSVVLLPPVLMLLLIGMTGADAASFATMGLPFNIIEGLFLIPLGVLGGWIFWLIGVRPAKRSPSEVERVFE
jgi:hypothetical protein